MILSCRKRPNGLWRLGAVSAIALCASSAHGQMVTQIDNWGLNNLVTTDINGFHNELYITLIGNNNFASAKQVNQTFPPPNIAHLVQVGDYNHVSSDQRGIGNVLASTQTGNNHHARFSANGSHNLVDARQLDLANFLAVATRGDFNDVRVHQLTGNNSASVNQAGLRHSADVVQQGNAGHLAIINQVAPPVATVRYETTWVTTYETTYVTTYEPRGGGGRELHPRAAAALQRAAPGSLEVVTPVVTEIVTEVVTPIVTYVPGPLTEDNMALIHQSGLRNLGQVGQFGSNHNVAGIRQAGTDLTARITQSGAGAIGLPNLVTIDQSGTANLARALQTENVGPSGADGPSSGLTAAQRESVGDPGAPDDEFYFPGGARHAEIRILQSNVNNSAEVVQSGRGQWARIEQTGSHNVASITQGPAATNATAVIRQSGNYNSWYITQTMPGQYLVVSQTGTNNSVAQIVAAGPGLGGQFGITPP